MSQRWMLYGATGYTAKLIAELCHEKGMKPVLAGRRLEKVKAIADKYGFEAQAFNLSNQSEVDKALQGCKVLLNCAGPFIDTYKPLVDACIKAKCHYLDITGEIGVFEAMAKRSEEAKRAGIVLLPGVGFDVVPSDCLLKWVAERVPNADSLELGIKTQGGVSRGTMKTMVRMLPEGNVVRRKGKLQKRPLGSPTIWIPFPKGERFGASIPWGDVATAYYSTNIPNITVYSVVPRRVAISMRAMNLVKPLLKVSWIQNKLQDLIDKKVTGPDEKTRKTARVTLWARAASKEKTQEAFIEVPEGYHFTTLTAVESVSRLLHKPPAEPGYLTPSLAFGSSYVTEFPGVSLDPVLN